jgi:hypothetical protein
MNSNNLLDCVDPEVYADPKFKTRITNSILRSPEENITLDNNTFTYVRDLTSLKDGDCVIAYTAATGILYGQLIKKGSQYKIRYLDSANNNPLNETIERPPNNDSTKLIMFNQFSDYNSMYNKNKSIDDVVKYFKDKKTSNGVKPLYAVTNNNDNISISFFNRNITITNKTDNLRIGIATNGEEGNKKETDKYYYLYDNSYVEKIQNLTPYVNKKGVSFYRNESVHAEKFLEEYNKEIPLEKVLTPKEKVLTNKDMTDIIKSYLSGQSKKAGGRRKHKRKSTKKIKKNKIRKGKKTRRSK